SGQDTILFGSKVLRGARAGTLKSATPDGRGEGVRSRPSEPRPISRPCAPTPAAIPIAPLHRSCSLAPRPCTRAPPAPRPGGSQRSQDAPGCRFSTTLAGQRLEEPRCGGIFTTTV